MRDAKALIGDLFAVPEDDTYSVGWNFNPQYGGAGLAAEAAIAFFRFLFAVKNARRLYAYVEDHNISSQRLCKRMGMRQEGLFKQFVSFKESDDGSPIYENTIQYAILRREWEAVARSDPRRRRILKSDLAITRVLSFRKRFRQSARPTLKLVP